MIRFRAYLFSIILLLPLMALAQGPTEQYQQTEVSNTEFDKNKWNRITEGVVYEVEKPKEKEKREPELEAPPEESESSPSFNFGEWSATAKIILISLFAVLIIVIILQVMKNKNQKIDKKAVPSDEEIIEQIEENIQKSDIDSFLDRAIADGNYSLAIRLHYLNILKGLSGVGIIKWKKDKTNRAYLYEIKDRKMKSDFRNLTNIFEKVWYGNVALQKDEFESLAPVFEIFSDNLKNSNS